MTMPGSTAAPPRFTGPILDGKAVAATLHQEVARAVESFVASGARRPKLVAVLVGDDPASRAYVGSKKRACEAVGLIGETDVLPESTPQAALEERLRILNEDPAVDGILVQLPLPKHMSERAILEQIDPAKDVDGFHPTNVGRLWSGETGLTPATPTGIIELLRRYDIPRSGRHAVVVGRSNIVGKPMAALLLREHCTVTICHSRTADLAAVCRGADILIAAVGVAGLIGPDAVRDGAVVVDVGMNRIADEARVHHLYPDDEARHARYRKRGYLLVGDVDYHRVAPKAGAITPVPGGVGPLTVAQLLVNTLRASAWRQGREAGL